MRRLFLLVLVVFLARPLAGEPRAFDVSMVQLIANPEKYDGKLITVIGFMEIGDENDLIYSHHEDDEHGILANAIWFEITPMIKEKSEILSGNYVLLTGRFTAKRVNYDPVAVGGIKEISRAERWSELKHPRRTLGRPRSQ